MATLFPVRDTALPTAVTHQVSRTGIISALVALWAMLMGASIVQDIMTGLGLLTDRIWMLDVEVETGIYTWFSTLLLAGAALVCGVIALEKHAAGDRLRFHWVLLALIFLALSADEACSMHEALSGRLTSGLGTSGALHFAWVIPAMLVCAAGLVLFIPLIMSFPPRLRTWLLVSAAAFLTGAIGMEMAAGAIGAGSEEVLRSGAYRLLANLEEALEGGAVILFIAVILAYRAASPDAIRLRMI
jgi:hypothetical protein